MDADNDREYSRQPRPEDLAKICHALNREGARYILIGRPTKDIDFLVDASPENVERIKKALAVLPDNAVRDVTADDVERYEVVRVADEVVVDLMAKACGITWEEAAKDSEILQLDGVEIPLAGIDTLIRTKLTVRPHDAADRGTSSVCAETDAGKRRRTSRQPDITGYGSSNKSGFASELTSRE